MDIDDAVDWYMIARKWEERCLKAEALNARLRATLKPLLEHYLSCYDGNKDALALEAGAALEQNAAGFGKYESEPVAGVPGYCTYGYCTYGAACKCATNKIECPYWRGYLSGEGLT